MSLDFLDANLVLNKKRLTEQRKRNLSKKAADVSKKGIQVTALPHSYCYKHIQAMRRSPSGTSPRIYQRRLRPTQRFPLYS